MTNDQADTCPPGVVILLFCSFSGEVKHIVRLIQLNLNSRLMPTWLDRHRSRLKKHNTQTFKLELSPIVLWNYSFLTALVVRSSPTMWSWPNTTPPWTASTTSSSTAPSHTAPLGTQRIFYHSTANLSPVHYHLPRLCHQHRRLPFRTVPQSILLDNLPTYLSTGRTDNLRQRQPFLHRNGPTASCTCTTTSTDTTAFAAFSGLMESSPTQSTGFDSYTFIHNITPSITYRTYPICSSWCMCRHSSPRSTFGSTTDTTSFTKTCGKKKLLQKNNHHCDEHYFERPHLISGKPHATPSQLPHGSG